MTYQDRQALITETRCWIGAHYEPHTSEPVAWENAVRAAFGLPTEADVLIITVGHFTPPTYDKASRLFRSVVDARSSNKPDAQWCLGAWQSIRTTTQLDLNHEQRKEALLTGVMDALQFYVTYHPGGLFDATRDLNVAASGDYESLLGGGE